VLHLTNQWRVHTGSPAEAAFLYREIFGQQCYLQHGLSVREGDVIVDAGANIGACTTAPISAWPL
jgi:hypothetical protein